MAGRGQVRLDAGRRKLKEEAGRSVPAAGGDPAAGLVVLRSDRFREMSCCLVLERNGKMANCQIVIAGLRKIAEKIEEQKEYLTELDQPIGDSDHGINLARGFAAVEKKLLELEDKDIGTILKTAGMALVSTVGGASGPLYGSALMKMGMVLAGKTEMGMEDFLAAMEAAVEAVKQRGKSTVEEATMLDAMVPALEAMKEEAGKGAEKSAVLAAGCKASWAGAEHTKDLVATKGRASYVGERGIGHQDPGATSFSFMLEMVKDVIGE